MRWGIRDTQDGTWIGNDHGPLLFDEAEFDQPELAEGMARIATQIAEMQVYGSDLGCKFQAEKWPEEPARKKEDIPVKMDPVAALRRIEGETG